MIKLSKTGSYALRSVVHIAKHGSGLVTIWEIAQKQEISENLLRRIISQLEKAGILATTKGRNGGIQLGKSPESISVYDILKAVGEELGISECTRGEHCEREDYCVTTHILWSLQKGFTALLKMHTVDKIIK